MGDAGIQHVVASHQRYGATGISHGIFPIQALTRRRPGGRKARIHTIDKQQYVGARHLGRRVDLRFDSEPEPQCVYADCQPLLRTSARLDGITSPRHDRRHTSIPTHYGKSSAGRSSRGLHRSRWTRFVYGSQLSAALVEPYRIRVWTNGQACRYLCDRA